MSSGLCSLLLLASLGVMVASQTHDLQVTFAHPPYTTLSIKAQTGCTNTTNAMTVWLGMCSRKDKIDPKTALGVCQEEGAKLCLSSYFRDLSCIAVVGEMHGLEYQAEVNVPPDVTFYNGTWPAVTYWTLEGNTSTMLLKRLDSVPVHRLVLTPVDWRKRISCPEVTLAGEEESAGILAFHAHWHQQLIPGCSYRTLFQPLDECKYKMDHSMQVDDRLQYVPITDENRAISGASVRAAASLSLEVLLLLVTLHQAGRMHG